jgi:hypothetical protein
MRRKLLVPILALAGLLATAVPAHADGPPAGAVTSSHGRTTKTVYHPTNHAWFVQIAVDTISATTVWLSTFALGRSLAGRHGTGVTRTVPVSAGGGTAAAMRGPRSGSCPARRSAPAW